MNLSIEPQVLHDAAGHLHRHALALDEHYSLPVPDTGRSQHLTRAGLAAVTGSCLVLLADLRALADGLDAFLRALESSDAQSADSLVSFFTGGLA